MIIRKYNNDDNLEWVRCRVLSFLDSAYFDNVLKEKEMYQNASIELVAEDNGKIVGLIDVEYEKEAGTVCYTKGELGGVIWHIAVMPEYRNKGLASSLLNEAILLLKNKGINRIEAWTRDDKWVTDWYERKNFRWKESYLHVYAENDECDIISDSHINKLHICNTFAHYVGLDKEEIKSKFKRVHECNLYILELDK